jgi:hypothetical protein
LGGNGYIEDSPMPRLLRDAQVLPVGEGTTNILVLDGLRVVSKGGAHDVLLREVHRIAGNVPAALKLEASRVVSLAHLAVRDLERVAAEGPDAAAEILKRAMDRLFLSYELALLLEHAGEGTPAAAIAGAALRRMIRRHLDAEARTSEADLALLVDGTVTSLS